MHILRNMLFLLSAIFVCLFETKDVRASDDYMRACWISYIDIQSKLMDLDEDAFRKKTGEMYDIATANSINTVIVHVRPMGDAIYPSSYFPYSTYISSSGCYPGYDPLYIMIEEAHKRGLRFEAWVNPYRLSHNNTTTDIFKNSGYYEKFKRFTIEYSNSQGESCLSLDPASEDAKQLILCGICEIVNNYDVDGIHFDDYFYVPGMFDELPIEEKMENVSDLIRRVNYNIKCIDRNCRFGISPAGNISYTKSQGTDIEKWLSEEGYVDYIMPQIYWTDNYIIDGTVYEMFSNRCKEWKSLNRLNIPMYVGLALYRVNEESGTDAGWSLSDYNLCEQWCKAYKTGYDGYALFRYAFMEDTSCERELINLNITVALNINESVGIIKHFYE